MVSRTLRSPFDSIFFRPYEWHTKFEFPRKKHHCRVHESAAPPPIAHKLTLTPVPLLGNRSPLADSRMRGSFVGLALDSSLADLALKFNVTLEAIALQTRHIVDTLNAKGHSIQEICISGGQAKNAPLVQLLADVCGIPVILPGLDGGSSVVLGAAMLGRFAAEVTTQLSVSSSASGAFKSTGSEDHGLYADQTRQERAPDLPTQLDQQSKGLGAKLWNIMVRIALPPPLYFLHSTHQTPPTTLCPSTISVQPSVCAVSQPQRPSGFFSGSRRIAFDQ